MHLHDTNFATNLIQAKCKCLVKNNLQGNNFAHDIFKGRKPNPMTITTDQEFIGHFVNPRVLSAIFPRCRSKSP